MSAAPTIPWLSSNAVKALLWSALYVLLTWTALHLGDGVWNWKDLASAELALLIQFVQQLKRPDIEAPVGFLNKAP